MGQDEEQAVVAQEEVRTPATTSHWPFWLSIIRFFQLAVSFSVLCLLTYVARVFNGDYFYTFNLSFISFIFMILFMLYTYIIPTHFPKYFSPKGHLLLNAIILLTHLPLTAVLIWECQVWDEAQAVVNASLPAETVARINSLPHEWIAIRCLRAATAMATGNCLAWTGCLVFSWKIYRRVQKEFRGEEGGPA